MIEDTHHFWEDTLKSTLNKTKVDELIQMINDNREVLEGSDEMYKLMIHVHGIILDAKLWDCKKKDSESTMGK